MQPHHRDQLLEQIARIRTKIDDAISRAANAADNHALQGILQELKTLREQRQELEAQIGDDSAGST